jgi:hypothetical protein
MRACPLPYLFIPSEVSDPRLRLPYLLVLVRFVGFLYLVYHDLLLWRFIQPPL